MTTHTHRRRATDRVPTLTPQAAVIITIMLIVVRWCDWLTTSAVPIATTLYTDGPLATMPLLVPLLWPFVVYATVGTVLALLALVPWAWGRRHK